MKGGGLGVPSLRDDDVVKGGVAFAKAGEADFDDHCWLSRDGQRVCLSFAETDRAGVDILQELPGAEVDHSQERKLLSSLSNSQKLPNAMVHIHHQPLSAPMSLL